MENEVLIDTLLKAALVRLATMEICGIAVDAATVDRCLIRGLFNQLGDDLWDIYEDSSDDRVTPFTLYLAGDTPLDPFDFYLRYTAAMSQNFTRRRRLAAFMGCFETLRDALMTLSNGHADPFNVRGEISRTITKYGSTDIVRGLNSVPHVDFDAVIFAFENTLLARSVAS